jgi:hypothetical protein
LAKIAENCDHNIDHRLFSINWFVRRHSGFNVAITIFCDFRNFLAKK